MSTHTLEAAKTGRAKCRGCHARIEQGELRFGERVPNLYGDGETTLWFHVRCAAFKRPEPFLAAVEPAEGAEPPPVPPDVRRWLDAARLGALHPRLPRLHGAEQASTGRARCRHCRQPIARGSWRLALVYFEEYRFEPSGYLHAACGPAYFETAALVERLRALDPSLSDGDLADIAGASDPPMH